MTIPTGIYLKIEAGSILNEKIAATSQILIDGNLEAIGTSDNPIIFTNNSDPLVGQAQQFYWKGISVKSGGKLVLDHGEIRYAGSSGISNSGSLDITNSKISNTQGNGIWLSCSSKYIRIENNEISKCGSLGIYISNVRECNLTLQKNVIKECTSESIFVELSNFKPEMLTGGLDLNTFEVIRIGGTLQQDLKLPKNIYVISSNVVIPSGITLTIDAGSIFKVKAIAGDAIKVDGTLNANGTSKESIVFTSFEDPQYGGVNKITYWGQFAVTSKGVLRLDYTQIKYSGLGKSNTAGNAIYCLGTLRMNNSTIENSKGNGIVLSTVIQPLLKNNSFINNVNYSVNNSRYSAMTIDATNNYWGSAAGPALYDTTTKTWSTDGGKISKGVSYIPFLLGDATGGSKVSADITYLNSSGVSKNVTARVTIQGGDIGTARNYYAEVYCSWDMKTWYKRAETKLTIPAGNTSNSVDLNYIIYQSGNLNSKVVLYEDKGGDKVTESETTTNSINVWYYLSVNDATGVRTDSYISAVDNARNDSYLISKRSDESVWVEYKLNGKNWDETGKTYDINPIENDNGSSIPNSKNSLQSNISPDGITDGTKDVINSKIKEVINLIDIDENKIIDIASFIGFEYDKENDAYISKMYCWQKDIGYNVPIFDTGAQVVGMSIDCEPIYFQYKDKDYLVELWKGQYWASIGCEIGFYERPSSFSNDELTGYAAIEDEKDMLDMKYILKRGSEVLIVRQDKTWWLTAFKPGIFSDSANLSMDIKLEFTDSEMLNEFKDALGDIGHKYILSDDKTIHFVFDKPLTSPPTGSEKAKMIWNPVNSKFCDIYNDVKNKHGITDNSPESYKIIINEMLDSIEI